jgi:hypothetical protein|tara:strand:- start:1078 stop:1329 length:252 start_codon:yes stop_codon:yes gene_type:complete
MTDDNKEIPMPTKAEEPVELQIADIKFCKTIIETATERGAWKADELGTVGHVYNKITLWLQQNEPKVETQAEETSSDNQGEEK